MNIMKRLTFEEALQKYGHVKVKFSSYFKFSFTFTGTFYGLQIDAHVGGSSSDIYNLNVDTNEIELQSIDFMSLSVYQNGNEIEYFEY